jgi:hypothetical protein
LAEAIAEDPTKSAPSTETLDDKGGELDLDQIKFTAPAGWRRKAASSGFVLAEYELPRAEGDEADGRLTVSSAGGDLEANIDRWRTQFGGKPAKETQEKLTVEGLEITLVDFSGDFNEQRGMMMGPSVLRKNYRMLAAIIPLGEMSFFVKAYGPQATMEAQAARFREFAQTARKKS